MTHSDPRCSPGSDRDADGRFLPENGVGEGTRFAGPDPRQSRGGLATTEARHRTAAELLADWPPVIRTVEDAQRRLQIIGDLCVRGLLPGAQAGAAVRSCEVWLKSEETRAGIQRVAELEEQLHRLETDRLSVRRGQHG